MIEKKKRYKGTIGKMVGRPARAGNSYYDLIESDPLYGWRIGNERFVSLEKAVKAAKMIANLE